VIAGRRTSATEKGFAMTTPKFINRHSASAYLERTWGIRCKPTTLAKLAVIGGGPPFHKDGRFPLYAHADLDAWAKARLGKALRSTTEHVAAA
jgi:hypothetical protein